MLVIKLTSIRPGPPWECLIPWLSSLQFPNEFSEKAFIPVPTVKVISSQESTKFEPLRYARRPDLPAIRMRFDEILCLLPQEEVKNQFSDKACIRHLAIYHPRILRRRHAIRTICQRRNCVDNIVL